MVRTQWWCWQPWPQLQRPFSGWSSAGGRCGRTSVWPMHRNRRRRKFVKAVSDGHSGNAAGLMATTKFLNCIVGVLGLALLTGCLPIPHTTDRSGEVRGRVLDARTRAPIQGAKIYFVNSPHHPTHTDATGYFHMKAIRNFHWAYVTPEGDWPGRKDKGIEVSYPHYLPHGFLPDTTRSIDVGDILLKPDK